MNGPTLAGDAPKGEPISVLNVAWGQDTGGQQYRLRRSWWKHRPEDRYVTVTQRSTFYEIEHRMDASKLIRQWIPEADVLHLHNDPGVIRQLRHAPPSLKAMQKPRLVHFHGTALRTRPDYVLESLQKYPAVAAVSTLDLKAIAPEVFHWLPQCFEPEDLLQHREASSDPDTLHIAHAPTNRVIKSTSALISAVEQMQQMGHKVTLDIIEKTSNAECLRRKGRADVFVDQLILGYGNNALEAMGMGIPVIAGVDVDHAEQKIRQKVPANTPQLMEATWNGFPFMSATEDTLLQALLQMRNADVRATYARKGMDHFHRFHTGSVVVDILRPLYLEAMKQ